MNPIKGIHYIREGKKGEIRYQESVTILDVTREEKVIYVNSYKEITTDPLYTQGMANFIVD